MSEDRPSSFGSLVAGATAATVVDSIIFPLDTIKTRSQASGGFIKNGGYTGLYRGIGSVVVCTVPSASIFFFTYEKFKGLCDQAASQNGSGSFLKGWKGHLVASSAAEAISCAVLAPAEIVKQRAQISTQQNSRQILQDLVKGKDLRGLWQGYVGLLGRNVPVTAIQFVLYENFKDRYRSSKVTAGSNSSFGARKSEGRGKVGDVKLSAIESGLCAAGSGSIAAAVTTPMDVLKTRIMLQSSSPSEHQSKTQYEKSHKSMVQLGKQVFREEGVRGLFKGLGLRVIWTSMGLSLYLGSYEAMKNYIDG